ncbi:MAG: tetratricopeptide repeat protein [Bacteroidota bacterium]
MKRILSLMIFAGFMFSLTGIMAQDYPAAEEFIYVDQQPTPINLSDVRAAIGYPEEAIKSDIEGDIICRILVDSSGKYVRHLVMNSGPSVLQEAVERHIAELTFSPAILEGKNVAYWINVPFRFKLISQQVRILEDAVSEVTDSLTGMRDNPGLWYRRGLYYLKLNKVKEAMADFEESIAINPMKNSKKVAKNTYPNLVKAYFGKASVLNKEGDMPGAIYNYGEAIRIASEMKIENVGVNRLLPQLHLEKGFAHMENDSSMEMAKKELLVASQDTGEIKCTAFQLLADIGIEEKDNENLVKYYDGLVECYPEQDFLKYSRGYYETQVGKYSNAIEDFGYVAEKVKVTPLLLATYNQMAFCYMKEKEFEKAFASVDKALVINVLNGESYYYRGLIHLEKGDKEKACEDFQKSINYQTDGLYLDDVKIKLEELCGVTLEDE